MTAAVANARARRGGGNPCVLPLSVVHYLAVSRARTDYPRDKVGTTGERAYGYNCEPSPLLQAFRSPNQLVTGMHGGTSVNEAISILGGSMKMPMLVCNRCGKNDTMMVDAPRLDDPRQYCVDCYAELFPPGWTDEYQPLTETPPTTEQTMQRLNRAIELLNGAGDDLLGSSLDIDSLRVLDGLLDDIIVGAGALAKAANYYLAASGQ